MSSGHQFGDIMGRTVNYERDGRFICHGKVIGIVQTEITDLETGAKVPAERLMLRTADGKTVETCAMVRC